MWQTSKRYSNSSHSLPKKVTCTRAMALTILSQSSRRSTGMGGMIFNKSPNWKVHGCHTGWSGWQWNVAAMTYSSFRECLIQVWRSSRELGDISHMTVWRVLHKRLSFQPYKFQLLQESKPNDWPHQRNFCTDMLNCLKQDNLFLDKIVLSDEAAFHLSGKVNHNNLIIWGSQNPHQVVMVATFCGHSDHPIRHLWTFHFWDLWKIMCIYRSCHWTFNSFVTGLLTP
jgi:hypothetical protein